MSDRRLAWAAGILALILYAGTWSPVVTWAHFGEDGPELEAVGRTLGVAHPTGYPLFTLLVRLAGLVLPPPWAAVNVVALLAAVGAVGFLALAGRRLGEKAFPGSPAAWTAGAIAASFFTVSLTWWRQAVIGEVYTLHVLLAAAVLALVFRGRPRDGLLAAYLLGLGCAHHLQTVPFLLVVVAYRLLHGRPRVRPVHLLAFVAPLTLYGVLIVRSRLGAEFDWGDPRTLQNLWWSLSGTPYRGNLFHGGLPVVATRWMRALFDGPLAQLGWAGTGLALGGLGTAAVRSRREGASLLILFAGTAAVEAAYGIPDPGAYYLPAVVAASLLAGLGGAAVIHVGLRVPRARLRVPVLASVAAVIAAGIAAQAVGTAPLVAGGKDDTGFLYAQDGTSVLEDGALVLAHGDGRVFSLWYGTSVLAPGRGIAVLYDNLLDWSWYRRQVRRTQPWVRLPEAPLPRVQRYRTLIDGHLGLRPVYVTELPAVLETRYELRPAGPLYRIVGRRPTAEASNESSGREARSRSGSARSGPALPG